MLEAVIFDVDGTLLDTERIIIRAWKEAGAFLGYDVTDEVLMKTRAVNVQEAEKIFEDYIGNGFSYKACRKERVRIAEEIIERESPILKSGVKKSLDYLKEKNIKLAVASSTDTDKTKEHLEASDILQDFEVIVGGDQVEKGKPHPDIFLRAAQLLGVKPEHCMVVEDSPAGLKAARAAGMIPVMVPDFVPPNEETRQISYAILESLEEMPDLILEFLK